MRSVGPTRVYCWCTTTRRAAPWMPSGLVDRTSSSLHNKCPGQPHYSLNFAVVFSLFRQHSPMTPFDLSHVRLSWYLLPLFSLSRINNSFGIVFSSGLIVFSSLKHLFTTLSSIFPPPTLLLHTRSAASRPAHQQSFKLSTLPCFSTSVLAFFRLRIDRVATALLTSLPFDRPFTHGFRSSLSQNAPHKVIFSSPVLCFLFHLPPIHCP